MYSTLWSCCSLWHLPVMFLARSWTVVEYLPLLDRYIICSFYDMFMV